MVPAEMPHPLSICNILLTLGIAPGKPNPLTLESKIKYDHGLSEPGSWAPALLELVALTLPSCTLI